MAITVCLLAVSCKPIAYVSSNIGQVNQTHVDLSSANFKVLGSFTGTAWEKKNQISLKGDQGVLTNAKKNLFENAKAAGVELTGSRALINLTTDIKSNSKHITATVSGEIIEFTK